MRRVRAVAMIVLALGTFLVGVWYGEDIMNVFRTDGVLVGLGLVAVGAALTPGGVGARVVAGFMILAAGAAGFVGGRYEATAAFHECTLRGAEVQQAVAAHHQASGEYPATLEVLPIEELPGARLLRPRVLEYRREEAGYLLVARDWAQEFRGTESEPFDGGPTGRRP